MIYDHCVIGGGIVGMASAMALQKRNPGTSVLVLEKADSLATHQTGHNSGVVHSGIYYQPGSLKARLSREGARATKEFCAEHGLPVKELGKLLVATDERDEVRLDDLEQRAAANSIEVRRIGGAQLREMEPHVAGRAALLVPVTSSVDYVAITRTMADVVAAAGGQVELGQEVTAVREDADEVVVTTATGEWRARSLVACAGLQSDRIARMTGVRTAARILPFRGEYFQLPADRAHLARHLIYPVPDPELPFLGVHLTPMVDGRVTVGPNAVLGLAREGYRKGSVALRDVRDIVGFGGFWKLARNNVRTGAVEMRNSAFKRGYLAAARRYCPELELSDLQPYEAGIRAQAVMPDGSMLHDFLVERTARTVHVLNAPSPAATSAIPIGEMIADQVLAHVA